MTTTSPTTLLIVGNEELLRDRATQHFLTQLQTTHGDDLSHRTAAADNLNAQQIQDLLSPELFGGTPVLHITTANKLDKKALQAVVDAVHADDCALIIDIPKPADAGGKNVITTLTKAGATYESVALSSKAWERATWTEKFAIGEFRANGLKPDNTATQALIDGEPDLRGIAVRAQQLAHDHNNDTTTPTPITTNDVNTVVTAKTATGFNVADALIARDPTTLTTAVRQALDAGTAPLYIQAACLNALRNIATIHAGKTPRLPPTKARAMQQQARNWTPPKLAKAIHEMGVIGETVRTTGAHESHLLAALQRAIT